MRRSRISLVLLISVAGLFVLGHGVAGTAQENGKRKQEIEWIDGYNLARRAGTESQRPVLLFLTMDGCRHCVRMERDAFKNESIVREIKKSFVPAKLHLDANSKLAEQLKVTIYPTTIIIHPDGKILDYARGFLTSDELSARMAGATRGLKLSKNESANSVVRK